MLSILFVPDEAQSASPTPPPRGRGTVLALAPGTAMTVLYQCREREKNPERNKDRFCGERSCCGTRLAIGQWRAPHAYKSRCDWLKGLAQQLEPRVCVPALLLSALPSTLAV